MFSGYSGSRVVVRVLRFRWGVFDAYLRKIQENERALCFERKTRSKAKLTLSRLLGSLWAVSGIGGSARACLAFRGLSCWGASLALCLWFRFWAWGCASCGGACGLCLESRVRRECASSSEVCPTGKLQWHFTCGFDFRHGL